MLRRLRLSGPRRGGAALAVIGVAALALALPVLAGAAERGRLTGAEIAQARAAGAVVVAGASLAGVGAFAWMTRAVGREGLGLRTEAEPVHGPMEATGRFRACCRAQERRRERTVRRTAFITGARPRFGRALAERPAADG